MNVEVRCFGEGAQTEDAIRIRSYSPPWLEMSKGSDPKLQKVLDPLSVDLAMVKDPPIETEIVHCHTWYTFFCGLSCKDDVWLEARYYSAFP